MGFHRSERPNQILTDSSQITADRKLERRAGPFGSRRPRSKPHREIGVRPVGTSRDVSESRFAEKSLLIHIRSRRQSFLGREEPSSGIHSRSF